MESKAGFKFLFHRAPLSENRFALFRTHSSAAQVSRGPRPLLSRIVLLARHAMSASLRPFEPCLGESAPQMIRRALRRAGNKSPVMTIAAFALFAGLAGHARALETPRPDSEMPAPAPEAPNAQSIWPKMGLDEALQAFEKSYRAPNSADRFHALNLTASQTVITDLSVLSAKLLAASKHSQDRVSLHPYIVPVYLSRQRRENWNRVLQGGARPPEVSCQTFAVSLNGRAYIIAPAHGVRGDGRYYSPPRSDAAVRLATEQEARDAIPLERRPSDLPARIVTLEGKLPTGENVRFESAALRGFEPLQALLPDPRMSFHNGRRGVEVDYERTEVFILPPEWSYRNRLGLHKATGFSGAPAIEKTPQGDAIVGHFTGHHVVKIGDTRITLGILEDYDAIRSAVEKFAALPGKDVQRKPTRLHP